MNLQETMDFLHCTSWQGSRLGLERITKLLHDLGDPQEQLKFIHVAGTNGKGSVCAMLASILTATGYRTGLYTSPHLVKVNERFQLNGRKISDEALIALAGKIMPVVNAMDDPPTEFERITAMALLYFAEQSCDFVVLEVGLGGRLDATNVIPAPELTIITNIGLEHTEVLGNTLMEIAREKAGIVKSGTTAVLYGQDAVVEDVVAEKCYQCGVPLRITDTAAQVLLSCDLVGQRFDYRQRKGLYLRLLGTYQYRNAAVALDGVDALIDRGFLVPESAVAAGLGAVVWPGRFEILQHDPLVLVDGAHNPNGVKELTHCLEAFFPRRTLTFVMGVMSDKDYGTMLETIGPFAKKIIAVTPNSHRSLPSAQLRTAIQQQLGLPALDAGEVQDGVMLALQESSQDDIICCFGSLYQVGEVRAYFGKYNDKNNLL